MVTIFPPPFICGKELFLRLDCLTLGRTAVALLIAAKLRKHPGFGSHSFPWACLLGSLVTALYSESSTLGNLYQL
jgi:hypothetical protein